MAQRYEKFLYFCRQKLKLYEKSMYSCLYGYDMPAAYGYHDFAHSG